MQSLAKQDTILSELGELRKQVAGPGAESEDEALLKAAPGNVLLDTLQGYLEPNHPESIKEMESFKSRVKHLASNSHQADPTRAAAIKLPESRNQKMRELFINSFHFNEMCYREQAIATPYGKTFQWMFKGSPGRKSVGFAQWLESLSSLFWVPGS